MKRIFFISLFILLIIISNCFANEITLSISYQPQSDTTKINSIILKVPVSDDTTKIRNFNVSPQQIHSLLKIAHKTELKQLKKYGNNSTLFLIYKVAEDTLTTIKINNTDIKNQLTSSQKLTFKEIAVLISIQRGYR